MNHGEVVETVLPAGGGGYGKLPVANYAVGPQAQVKGGDLVAAAAGEVKHHAVGRNARFFCEFKRGGYIQLGGQGKMGELHGPEYLVNVPPLPILDVQHFHVDFP